jgi:archaetidylinositol phosphate synthase
MNKSEFFGTWSILHGDARVSGIVKWWLTISFLIAKALAKIRISPNGLTLFGLAFGVLLYLNAQSIWAPIFLVLSLICDGIDGSLAIITRKFSKWGAMLDSVIDRLTEVFWILALYSIGVEFNLLAAVLLLAVIQEYLRARAGGVGVVEVGVVTYAERPVRASFVFIALIAFNLSLNFLNQIIAIWLVLQVISLIKIGRFVFRKLD